MLQLQEPPLLCFGTTSRRISSGSRTPLPLGVATYVLNVSAQDRKNSFGKSFGKITTCSSEQGEATTELTASPKSLSRPKTFRGRVTPQTQYYHYRGPYDPALCQSLCRRV